MGRKEIHGQDVQSSDMSGTGWVVIPSLAKQPDQGAQHRTQIKFSNAEANDRLRPRLCENRLHDDDPERRWRV